MGAKANDNPLNHDLYLDADAVAAMGAKANDNPLNHNLYLNSDAVAAMGVKANGNPLNHDRLNNVTSAEIVDGTINPVDINASGHFTFDGITNTGPTIFDSTSDIRINDNINGFRWYNTAGDTQLAYFFISSNLVRFQDYNQSRALLYSDSNGIGIGTNNPSSTHAVTMPSLVVTGNLGIGLEIVTAGYSLGSAAACHSHGDLTCYYGSGSVSCPVGTKVLGGGTNGTSSARYGSVSTSYPNSSTSWFCASSYDLSVSDSCYAICARLE
jgi:hypothetical protein